MNRPNMKDFSTYGEYDVALNDYCDELGNKYQELLNIGFNRDKDMIDQLHYVHEHVYAAQGDFYSNGGHLNAYHVEKLETAMSIIQNTLGYVRREYFGKQCD